ncbi:TauD/TfdA family dioxygenase [Knoellia sp. CPCC 206453]|uniref:TauD/TfdA family dioxygenase n=1 Tax=Knoellia pratensis TaxID=3404796 RepID=UPI00360D0984
MTTTTNIESGARVAGPSAHHVLDLGIGDAEQIHSQARDCAARYANTEDPQFHEDLGELAEHCPPALRRGLRRFRTSVHAETLIVRGLTVDDEALEPTPPSWSQARTVGVHHAFTAALVASALGECIGWGTQQAGRLITDIVPTRGMEESLVSSSSALELGWHTEDAFSDYRADYVGLFGLRDTGAAATTIASVDVDELPAAVRATLFEERFITHPDDAHDSEAGAGLRPTPILSGHREAPLLRIDRDFTEVHTADDDVAHAALRHVRAHLDERIVEVPMRPGDMVFLDNRKVVHGRRPFTPRYDGTDRWLKRVNVVVDLTRTAAGRHDLERRIIG